MTNKQLWAGRIMCMAAILFLAFDSISHMLRTAVVVAGAQAAGMSLGTIVPIGVTLFVCLVLFVIPRTAFLGALLTTAYLGGAVAANVITHALPLALGIGMPVLTAIFLWSGLYVTSPHLRALVGKKINS